MIFKNSILPFYTKAGIFFVGLSALLAILFVAQSIIVPLIFAFIIAILLHPVVNFFIRIKINRIFAIIITLLLTVFIIIGVSYLLYNQAVGFSDSWPIFVKKFGEILNQTIKAASHYFNIRPSLIHAWLAKTEHDFINFDGTFVGQTIVSLGSIIATLVLVPVYTFVILYYKPLLIEFVHRLFNEEHQFQVSAIVSETKSVVQHYLVGLIIEAIIVGALNAIGLLMLGIEYAIIADKESQHIHIQIGDEPLGCECAEIQVLRLDAMLGQHRRRADGLAGRGGLFVVDALALGGSAIAQAQVQGTSRFIKVDAVFGCYPFQLAGVADFDAFSPFVVLLRVVEGLFFIAEAHALEREMHRGHADADPIGLPVKLAEPFQRQVHFLQEECFQVQFPFGRNGMGVDGLAGAGFYAAGFVEQLLDLLDSVRADMECPCGLTNRVVQRVIQNPLS